MEKDKVQKYKDLLLLEKKRLEDELATVGRKNPDNPNDWEAIPPKEEERSFDPNDRADNIEDYENNTAILKELEIQLTDVNDALKKVEEGNYGVCEVSGEEIEPERLDANPAARTCKLHMQN